MSGCAICFWEHFSEKTSWIGETFLCTISLYNFISHAYNIVSCRVLSCPVVSCRVLSCPVMSWSRYRVFPVSGVGHLVAVDTAPTHRCLPCPGHLLKYIITQEDPRGCRPIMSWSRYRVFPVSGVGHLVVVDTAPTHRCLPCPGYLLIH